VLAPGVDGGVISRDDLFVEFSEARSDVVVAVSAGVSERADMGGTTLVVEDEASGVETPVEPPLSFVLAWAILSVLSFDLSLPLSFFASG
jgi:hypothetical protein